MRLLDADKLPFMRANLDGLNNDWERGYNAALKTIQKQIREATPVNLIEKGYIMSCTLNTIKYYCRKQRDSEGKCTTCKISKMCDTYFGKQGASVPPEYWESIWDEQWQEKQKQEKGRPFQDDIY